MPPWPVVCLVVHLMPPWPVQASQKNGDPPMPKYGFVRNFGPEEMEWLAQLPAVIEMSDLDATVNHCGWLPGPPSESLYQQQAETVVGYTGATLCISACITILFVLFWLHGNV